jgi:hypothetical protein
MKQNALTVIVPILPEMLEFLRDYLSQIGHKVENNPYVRFRETPSTHSARWVILEDPPEPPRLYFSACFDGTLESYLTEITSKLGAGMEPIWTCCKGYSARSASNHEQFKRFLLPHSFQPNIFLVAFPGLSAKQILDNMTFRMAFDDYLDTVQNLSPVGSSATPHSPSAVARTSNQLTGGLAKIVGSVTDWLVGVHPGVITPNVRIPPNKYLSDMEDKIVQNQMTVLSSVKKQCWPRLLLRFFLFLGEQLAKPSATGQLSGLSTIHFARWALIDDGNTLLFESVYDGSWESYIDDFRDHAASGMNAIWANCDGYPKGGCLDIEYFKQLIRSHQHPAEVFYSAYPDQTLKNIASDLTLRKGLASASLFMSGSYDATQK